MSPNGTGLLTEYGRNLSKDVLSTWSGENEHLFAYGLVKQPEWLNLGGDYRGMYLGTAPLPNQHFITMQVDLEAGVTVSQFTFVGSLGINESLVKPQVATEISRTLMSRKHYVLFQPSD